MKKITIILPTSLKEIRSNLKQAFKWVKAPKRANHNQKVFSELEKDICGILNSGYWDKDISETMRKRLTSGLPNGEISRHIWGAYRKIK